MHKALLVPLVEAAQLLGIAEKTARNWTSAGKFPVKTFLIGSKRMVRVADLEQFVASLGCVGAQQVLTTAAMTNDSLRRPRGRPRKTVCLQPKLEGGQIDE